MGDIFSKTELKNIQKNKNKSTLMRFMVTEHGMQFLPWADKDCRVMAVLKPVTCEYSKEFLNELCSVEDYGFIARMADVIDFSGIRLYMEEEKPYMSVAGKTFPVHWECLIDDKDNTFYTRHDQYQHTAVLTAENTQAVKHVAPCVSDDRARYFMCGVFLSPYGDAVATDGHRMSWQKLDEAAEPFTQAQTCFHLGTSDEGFFIPDYIIPFLGKENVFSWSTHEKVRKIKDAPDEKYVATHARFMLEADGNAYLYVPVEGQFPNYKRVIPEYAYTDAHDCCIDFSAFKSVKKDKVMRMCAKGSKAWQEYDGVNIPLNLSLPLDDEVQVNMCIPYVSDMQKAFGKRFEGKMSWLADGVTGGYITKAVMFHNGYNDPYVLIMPLSPSV